MLANLRAPKVGLPLLGGPRPLRESRARQHRPGGPRGSEATRPKINLLKSSCSGPSGAPLQPVPGARPARAALLGPVTRDGRNCWPHSAARRRRGRSRRAPSRPSGCHVSCPHDPENQTRIGAFHQDWRRWGGPTAATCGWTPAEPRPMPTTFASTWSNWPHLHRMQSWLVLALRPSRPLLQATRTMPVVFVVVVDPVGTGFVASLARPGGNATGFLMFVYGLSSKWLEVLKQIAPGVRRVAIFRDRHPVRGAITRDGSLSDQRSRLRRDRARHHRLGARFERRRDHAGTNIIDAASSRSDRRACIAACGLPQRVFVTRGGLISLCH
jgi:ABC transporter substrate binding protein